MTRTPTSNKNYDLFIRFLKENKFYDIFISNVMMYGSGYKQSDEFTWDFFKFVREEEQFSIFIMNDNYLQNAFNWSLVKEGNTYWNNVNRLWFEYLNSKIKARD